MRVRRSNAFHIAKRKWMSVLVAIGVAALGTLVLQGSAATRGSLSDNDELSILKASRTGEDLLADAGSRNTYLPASWHGGQLTVQAATTAHAKLASDLGRT